MYFLDIIVVKKHLKYGQHLLKQAFNSIDGTVVPYWSLKKFFNYHNRVFPDAQICAFWRMFSTNDPLNELTLRNTGRTQFASQYELTTAMTFKVATKMLHATRHPNMVIITVK